MSVAGARFRGNVTPYWPILTPSRRGFTEQSYYRWRREYGGLKLDQAKRLKDLERENDRLKRAVSELTLDKLILKEALEGKY